MQMEGQAEEAHLRDQEQRNQNQDQEQEKHEGRHLRPHETPVMTEGNRISPQKEMDIALRDDQDCDSRSARINQPTACDPKSFQSSQCSLLPSILIPLGTPVD